MLNTLQLCPLQVLKFLSRAVSILSRALPGELGIVSLAARLVAKDAPGFVAQLQETVVRLRGVQLKVSQLLGDGANLSAACGGRYFQELVVVGIHDGVG